MQSVSVHQFTTLASPAGEDVATAVRAAAEGLGLSEWKCGPHQVEPMGQELHGAGLGVSSYLPAQFSLLPFKVPLQPPPIEDPRARLANQIASVERASSAGADLFVVVLGPGETKDDLSTVRSALRELAGVAAEHDVAVGIEYLARSSTSILPGWEEFLDFVEDVDQGNIGIVMDVQHVAEIPDILATSNAWASRLMLVQVSGVSEHPRGPFDRLLPGGGQMALLAELVEHVLETGYSGWWEIEILSDDGRLGSGLPDSLWRLPPSDYVPAAVDTTRALLSRFSG